MSAPVAPLVPENMAESSWGSWLAQIARNLNLLLQGRYIQTITLTPNATTTVVLDSRIGGFSGVFLEAQTASAAAARAAGVYVAPTSGRAIVTHPADPATDQRFMVLVVG